MREIVLAKGKIIVGMGVKTTAFTLEGQELEIEINNKHREAINELCSACINNVKAEIIIKEALEG